MSGRQTVIISVWQADIVITESVWQADTVIISVWQADTVIISIWQADSHHYRECLAGRHSHYHSECLAGRLLQTIDCNSMKYRQYSIEVPQIP